MDSLTQIVLGASVGELVLGKKVGNKALFWGAVAGTIPDLDVIARYVTDVVTATEMHRGFSHSILFCVIFAPFLGFLVSKIHKKQNVSWRGWAWLFFWGMFTHPLLDAFTTWGTQLFWPFSERLAFNSIFVVDPLYTFPFLVCVIIILFKPKGAVIRAKINRLGIYLSSGYLLITLLLKLVVYYKVELSLKQQGVSYSNFSTRPAPLTTVLWNINVDLNDSYLIGDYSFFDTKPIQYKQFFKNRDLVSPLINTDEIKRLRTISEGWYILEKENTQWVYNDLRFGLINFGSSKQPRFVFRYLVKNTPSGIAIIEDRPTNNDAKQLLTALWTRIKGN